MARQFVLQVTNIKFHERLSSVFRIDLWVPMNGQTDWMVTTGAPQNWELAEKGQALFNFEMSDQVLITG